MKTSLSKMKKELKVKILRDRFDALWLIIDRNEGVAYPILENEVKPIMEACKRHLKKRI